jgi:hypothetical protein
MSGWSPERSALIADALRLGNGLARRVGLRVYGQSMLPTLWPGHEVEITSCSLEKIQPGDIVLALRDGRLFLHRLIKSTPTGFVLRGDSMPAPDPQYPPEALLGRLVSGTHSNANLHKQRGSIAPALHRAMGLLFCHCALFRRVALKLHSRRNASGREFRSLESL